MIRESLQKWVTSRTFGPMRTAWVLAVLVGCGGHEDPVVDAQPDAVVVALDCPTYCREIQTNCTGANAQYPDVAHCMATCSSFTVGTGKVTDTSGNTLGCRIYHAGAPSMATPDTHCAHAGPGGDQITASPLAACSGGDVCASFCALEIKACGSVEAPLPGNPIDATGNQLFQYQNMTNCMISCAAFDKTHAYSTASVGNSLACRLLQATSAAIAVTPNAQTECRNTGVPPRVPCAGVPMP